MTKKNIHILILLLISAISYAQTSEDDKYVFEKLTINDGLSNNTVGAILKDHYGFMWFGTYDGLNRYNGYEFEVFRPKGELPISDNFITYLYEDSRNLLWIGTRQGGVNVYDQENMKYYVFMKEQNNKKQSISSNYIYQITEDEEGNIWLATQNGLSKCNMPDFKFETYFISEKKEENAIWSFANDSDKKIIWIGCKNGKVFKFNKKEKKFIPRFIGTEKEKYPILDIYINRKKEILFGTEGNGLYILNPKNEIKIYNTTTKGTAQLKHDVVRDLYETTDGKLWIATDGGGLNILEPENNKITYYQEKNTNKQNISSNAVFSIYENDNAFWIGTVRGGINIIKKQKPKIKTYTHINKTENSLVNDNVLRFQEIKNEIWIGTDGGGLSIFNPLKNEFKNFRYPKDKIILGNSITTIMQDNEQNIWLGAYGKGISIIDNNFNQKQILTASEQKEGTLKSNNIWVAVTDSEGKIWIGTRGGGLSLYEPKTKTFKTFMTNEKKAGSISNNFISDIIETKDNKLWIGTFFGGLNLFDKKTEKFKVYKNKKEDSTTISSNSIITLFTDNRQQLWIGTDGGGLNLYNPEDETFTSYDTKDKLPNNTVKGIRQDRNELLWLSTNKGLCRFNPTNKKVLNLDVSDGLQSYQFLHRSCLYSKDKIMYFGGIAGFNSFDPLEIRTNEIPPEVHISDFKIKYKSVNPKINETKNKILQKNILNTREIELIYSENMLSFEFVALDYTAPEKNKYAYKLEGYDDKFIYVGAKQRYASYSNLKPGKYIFRVKASNNSGIWSEKGDSLKITIVPPYWKTLWFRVLIILFISSSILLAVLYRIKKTKENQRKLEYQVMERTAVINEQKEEINQQNEELLVSKEILEKKNEDLNELNSTKDKFFSIIAHDLKNPFSSFMSATELLKDRYEKLSDKDKYELIRELHKTSKKLYNLLENLLNWAVSQTGQIKFEPEIISLNNIIKGTVELLKFNAEEKNINILTDIKEKGYVFADKNMLTTSIRNIISNAIKFTNQDGKIEVRLKIDEYNAKIEIEDSGIGISEEDIPKLFRIDIKNKNIGESQNKGTGLGLILCKEFVEKNNGTITVTSKLNVGSTFTITLPLKKNDVCTR